MRKIYSKIYAFLLTFKNRAVEQFYLIYFCCCNIGYSVRKKYLLIDIDNTVNNQGTRLRKFINDGQCDYKRANQFRELVRDVPLPGSVDVIIKLSKRFRIIWLSSRSIKIIPVTYYWLKKNGFPVHALVCTGSMTRKIGFIELFIKKHTVDFVIDDMKEGYEYGNPQYVFPYKKYLELNKIEVFEYLSAAELQIKLKDYDV